MPVATTSTRKRKPKPATVHPAGSAAAVADVRFFVKQEARRRVRRAEEREIARRLQNRERRRLI